MLCLSNKRNLITLTLIIQEEVRREDERKTHLLGPLFTYPLKCSTKISLATGLIYGLLAVYYIKC